MKRYTVKAGVLGIIIFSMAISFALGASAGEKKKFAYISKGEKMSSSTNLHDSNDLRNKITQWSRPAIITEHSDPSLVGSEQTVHGQSNYSAYMDKEARGLSRGYTITKSKAGDCFYSKWESTWSVVTLAHADWETNEEVRFQIIGGTGKYSNAKGNGSCQSKGTPKGVNAKCEGEWEY
jgi:hypothetical protein